MKGPSWLALLAFCACSSPRREVPTPDAAAPGAPDVPAAPPARDAVPPADQARESSAAPPDGAGGADLGAADLAPDGASPDIPAAPSEVAPPAIPCGADQLRCNESPLCEARSWGFEQGAEGWNLLSYNGRISGRRVRTGAAALGFEVFPGMYSSTSRSLCGRKEGTQTMFPGVDVRGTTLVAWVNLEVTEGQAAPTTCLVGGGGGGAVFRSGVGIAVTPDRWVKVRAPIAPADSNGSNVWSIYVECWYEMGPAWKGIVHVDDIAFE